MRKQELQVIKATSENLQKIVILHYDNLAGDLVDMGPAVLSEFYRKGFVNNNIQVYMGVVEDRISGFAVITDNEESTFRKNLYSSIWAVLRLFIIARKRPLIKTILRKFKGGDEGVDVGPSLLYLAIDKHLRCNGLGRKLLNAIELKLKNNSETKYHLQVKCENSVAINFYMNNGFIEIRYVPERELIVLEKELSITNITKGH